MISGLLLRMYDSILVATDGSAAANRAVTHALEQAEQHGAQLHAVFVVDTDRYSEPALSSMELQTHAIEDWGNQQLAEIVERAEGLDVDVTKRCCHGKPSVEIINYADEVDADLIVLGYQGQDHTKTDQIGSVTDRVVQNAGRPVLVAT
jgi:nucleotide-binding universal stress UspA family protein